jgi:hypothetical protein
VLINPAALGRFSEGINSFGIGFHHKGFRKDGMNIFDFHKTIYIKFDEYKYQMGHQHKANATYLYSDLPLKDELAKIVNEIMKGHLEEIKKNIGKDGK